MFTLIRLAYLQAHLKYFKADVMLSHKISKRLKRNIAGNYNKEIFNQHNLYGNANPNMPNGATTYNRQVSSQLCRGRVTAINVLLP